MTATIAGRLALGLCYKWWICSTQSAREARSGATRDPRVCQHPQEPLSRDSKIPTILSIISAASVLDET